MVYTKLTENSVFPEIYSSNTFYKKIIYSSGSFFIFFGKGIILQKLKFRPSKNFEGLNLMVNSSILTHHSSFNTLAGLV